MGYLDMKDKYKKLILATDELVKSQFIEMFGLENEGMKRQVMLRAYVEVHHPDLFLNM